MVHTAPQVPTPSPLLQMTAVPGGLLGGSYVYAISAYTDVIAQETLLSTTIAGTLSGFGGWRLDLPLVPSGATGFNVYRPRPRR